MAFSRVGSDAEIFGEADDDEAAEKCDRRPRDDDRGRSRASTLTTKADTDAVAIIIFYSLLGDGDASPGLVTTTPAEVC